MKIVQRLIFYMYTLLFTLLSLGVVLVCLRVVSPDFLWTSIAGLGGDLAKGLAGVALFGLGVWVLLAGFFKKKDRKAFTYYTIMGNVNISLEAIENFIEKMAKSANGIRDAKVEALLDPKTGTGVTATVKITVSQDVNISQVASEMQEHIHECVKNTIGAELDEIKIIVETISNDFKVKSRVQ